MYNILLYMLNNRGLKMKLVRNTIFAGFIAVAGIWGGAAFYGAKSISQLLGDNKKLQASLSNLTYENQVAYAKVIDQQIDENGEIISSTISFKEFLADDPTAPVFTKELEIKGDIVHFDAIVITFPSDLVADGKKKSLYLWHRAYGDQTPPTGAVSLEQINSQPERYKEIFSTINHRDRKVFWDSLWSLSSDLKALDALGIKAAYGSGLYFKVKPKVIYEFNFSATGQMSIAVKPEI